MKIAVVSLGRRQAWSLFGKELSESLSSIIDVCYIGSVEADHKPILENELLVSTGGSQIQNLLKTMDPFSKLSILQFLKKNKVEAVIFPVRHPWLPLLYPFLKCKKVLIVHDAKHHPGEQSYIYEKIDHWLWKHTDLLVTLCNYNAYILKMEYPHLKVLPLFHPIYEFYKNLTPAQPPENLPRKFMLFFGRMIAYKGMDLLSKAWESLAQDFPDTQLVIAGSGPERFPYGTRVTLINRTLTDQELVFLIDRSEIVVAPYIEASQSGVVATAMAREKIVVSTDVGGLKEQVINGETGFLAAPDPISLAEKLRIALQLGIQEKNRMKNAIRKANQDLSWEIFVKRLIENL
jgi:glycosyltransferase involved in cell wall biosynthesis